MAGENCIDFLVKIVYYYMLEKYVNIIYISESKKGRKLVKNIFSDKV